MSLSSEQTQLIEDGIRLETVTRILKDVDCDSITEVKTVADRREALKRLQTIRNQLRDAVHIARRKRQRLYA